MSENTPTSRSLRECADRRLVPRTDRLRGSRPGVAAARQRTVAVDPRPDRPHVPQERVSGSGSERQLRRWSVAELIARSFARPDDDLSEPWGSPRAPSAW